MALVQIDNHPEIANIQQFFHPRDLPMPKDAQSTFKDFVRSLRGRRMLKRKTKLKPGQVVILMALPPGFIDDLPEEEQPAISARIGRPILLLRYEQDGMAVLEFMDKDDGIHTLYVDPKFIRKW